MPFHHILLGLILGWGAAIPIGPMNIEIIRRNLSINTRAGLACGAGACLADLSYLVLVSIGAMALLQDPTVMRVFGVVGALILIYFAIGAFRMKSQYHPMAGKSPKKDRAWRHLTAGYFMTASSPYTILFWASMSTQVASLNHQNPTALLWTGAGILLGTFSWAGGLNTVLHFTRHRLPDKTMHYLNITGGVILIAFACFGLFHSAFPLVVF